MVQRQSSEKKEQQKNRLSQLSQLSQGQTNGPDGQPRSSSQMSNDTAAMLKERGKAVYQPQFKIGLLNSRKINQSNKKSPYASSQVTEEPKTKNLAEPKPLVKIDSIEAKIGEEEEVPSSGAKMGGHLHNQLYADKENGKISEILDQESYDPDTPLERPKARDGKIGRDGLAV